MRATDDFLLEHSFNAEWPIANAEKIFDRVWRYDFTAPGFFVLDFGRGVDSHVLRSQMVLLKEKLSEVAATRRGQRFAFRSMGRFDQQETTKFHLDGAPAASLLMLGYEPSNVRSRLFLADYCRCAFDLGIESTQFLKEFNPMFRKGEEALSRYVTELPRPEEGHSRILLINNSSLPFDDLGKNTLGVMHKAEIINPTEAEQRIVNSIMLGIGDGDLIGEELQREFVATDQISTKVYRNG